jgi:hypothetical protein
MWNDFVPNNNTTIKKHMSKSKKRREMQRIDPMKFTERI